MSQCITCQDTGWICDYCERAECRCGVPQPTMKLCVDCDEGLLQLHEDAVEVAPSEAPPVA